MKLLPYLFCLAVLLPLSAQAQSSLAIGKDGAVEVQTPDGLVSSGTDGSNTLSNKQGEGDGSIPVLGKKGYLSREDKDSKALDSGYINTSLVGKDFSGKKLSGINFTNADLSSANLQSTDLSNALLTNANLKNADLTKANLTGAEITNTDFTEAQLAGAIWINGKICGKDSVGTCH